MNELSESLKEGILPGIIVAVYLIIIKIIDTRKEIKHGKLNSKITDCIINLNNFLDHITKNIINDAEEKRDYAIKTSFKAFANSLIKYSTSIIITNHIEYNKTNIIDNINNIVNSYYEKLYNNLFLYKLANYLNPKWKEDIKNDIISIIYNSKFSKEEKLYNINNKVNIKIGGYISYIMKKCHTNGK